ncbi:MAG: deoxyuridine 5'-triphosphate nucleotidohydrolase [Bacilli bacterium]|nr:deoxyuridine 5'-triphosphate nucleotidohydrolase [Bacilli bacterium]
MRFFEKISFDQFKKDIDDDISRYHEYNIPSRSTKNSAGYDISLINDINIKPNQIIKIPTGIKVCMNNNEVLLIVMKSSLGFKYNLRLTNQIGVIDADYYNNESNEGHIFISLQNEGTEELFFKKNDHIAQGIFVKYETVDEEKEINKTRIGGIGSTKKEELQ